MGRDVRKPVLGVSDKVSFRPVSSATETRWRNGNLHVASLDTILSKKGITTYDFVVCYDFVVHTSQRQVFSHRGPYKINIL